MEQFWQKKCDIKYGQCWVFSGLVTTCMYKKTVNSIMTPLMQSNLKRRKNDKGPCNVALDHWLYGSKLKRGRTYVQPSDSGQDAKVKRTRKVGGAMAGPKKGLGPSFLPFYFRVSRLLSPLNLRTRMTTSTRFDVKFFRVLSKNSYPGILHCTFFH